MGLEEEEDEQRPDHQTSREPNSGSNDSDNEVGKGTSYNGTDKIVRVHPAKLVARIEA